MSYVGNGTRDGRDGGMERKRYFVLSNKKRLEVGLNGQTELADPSIPLVRSLPCKSRSRASGPGFHTPARLSGGHKGPGPPASRAPTPLPPLPAPTPSHPGRRGSVPHASIPNSSLRRRWVIPATRVPTRSQSRCPLPAPSSPPPQTPPSAARPRASGSEDGRPWSLLWSL